MNPFPFGWNKMMIDELYTIIEYYSIVILCRGLNYFKGGARHRNARAISLRFRFTNRRNKGLISVDRKTSLLSYLQYPVPNQSRLQRIYRSQCPKRRLNLVLGRSLSLRVNTESGEYRRFPA